MEIPGPDKFILTSRSSILFMVMLWNLVTGGRLYAQCPVPDGLTAGQITSTSAYMSWDPVAADSFLLRYFDVDDSVYLYLSISSGTSTGILLTGLKPNTTYNWQLRTWCNNGNPGAYQAQAAIFSTDIQPAACIAPNQTAHSGITSSTADLSWNEYITADTFMIRYAENNTTNFTWVQVPGNQHNVTLQGLTPNTTYEWAVRCVCSASPLQSYSNKKVFSTFADSCLAPDPAYFSSTSITPSSALVGWDSLSYPLSYNVRYAVRYSGNWTTVPSVNASVQLNGLQGSTWYEFQVQSVCSNGPGQWSSSGIFQTLNGTVSVTRGPYLQLSTQNSIYIRWRTNIPSDSRVSFGTNPANLNTNLLNTTATTEHIVQLTGLTENTRYYYAIGTSTGILQGDASNTFKTNPAVGSTDPVRIWAIGDFGRGNTAQRDVRDSYEAYTGNVHTDVWLWLGDNAYNDGTDPEYQTKVFDVYPQQFKKWVSWPASGNHDLHSASSNNQTGPYYENFTMPAQGEAGGVPSHTEAYYSYDYGNIHFVCLESYGSNFRSVSGDMAAWLHADLTANNQTFTVVYFHHPPYSKGSHDSDVETELVEMRTNIIPILENYKVDLVLAGHSHSYERSMMIHGHYGLSSSFDVSAMAIDAGSGTSPNAYVKNAPDYFGTVYVVCGTSGSLNGTTSGWPHNAMHAYTVNHYGSLVIDVQGNIMTCRYLTSSGNIRDEFTIIKPGFPNLVNKTGDIKSASRIVSVWPNPIIQSTVLEYYLSKPGRVSWEVLDPSGRLVYKWLKEQESTSGSHKTIFPFKPATLPRGIYFIRMLTDDHTDTDKIIIE